MSGKKLILTQEQLDEICGGNAAYLDNMYGGFKNIGNNEVTADGFLDGDFADPMTTDKHAEIHTDRGRQFSGIGTRGREKVSYMAYEGKENDAPVIYEVSKKEKWAKKNLNEEYKDPTMTNAKFTTGNVDNNGNQMKRSLGSMKTLKTRYRAAQANAQSTDPEKRKRGLSTLKTMDKNDPNLKYELGQYSNLQASAKNIRKMDKETFGKPEIDRSGSSNGNGKAHSKKDDEFSDGFITYDA